MRIRLRFRRDVKILWFCEIFIRNNFRSRILSHYNINILLLFPCIIYKNVIIIYSVYVLLLLYSGNTRCWGSDRFPDYIITFAERIVNTSQIHYIALYIMAYAIFNKIKLNFEFASLYYTGKGNIQKNNHHNDPRTCTLHYNIFIVYEIVDLKTIINARRRLAWWFFQVFCMFVQREILTRTYNVPIRHYLIFYFYEARVQTADNHFNRIDGYSVNCWNSNFSTFPYNVLSIA